MKKLGFTIIMSMMLASFTALLAQGQREEYLGLPGDNLNLYAVLKLFQESETLEGFERNLNDQNSTINNLDLDGDNRVDYIRVIDNVDGDVHNIILQVAISAREFQDVAVFTVMRDARGQVQIQLIGDEALYGRNYIIEPYMELSETPNPGYTGNVTVVRTTTYEIAAWPLVRFMLLPTYVVWHSPWYYGYYPHYWNPWQPFYWHYYYGYHSHWNDYYYSHYSPCNYHRYDHYDTYYYSSRRAYSPHVSTRIQSGYYKTTYSKPEQRKEGEAYYNRRYSEQSARSSGSNPSSINARRQSTGTTTEQKSGSNSSSINGRRQSAGTATTQTKTGTTTARKSSGTTTTRQSTGTSINTRKQATTSTSRQSSGTGSSKQATTSNTTRRETTAGTGKTSKSSSGQVARGASTTKKSSSAEQGTSTRKSSGESSKSKSSGSSRR